MTERSAARPGRARRPRQLAAAIDEICAPWQRQDSPGCVVAVLRDGEVIHARGYGMADLARGIPLSPHSRLDVGSLSKQFTAMCVALLARRGKLALDDDVRRYLPELPSHGTPITIRHLVHHTSGVREYLDLLSLAGRRHLGASAAEVLALLGRQRSLNFAPGEHYQYSNSNYVLLAAIVARAAGRPLGEFARANVFEPLGMSSTGFEEGDREAGGDLALAYSPLSGGGFAVDASGINLAGDGAVLSSAEDLCRWQHNFDDNRLAEGGPALIREVTEPGRLTSGAATNYAFGLILGRIGDHPVLYHNGNYASYVSHQVRYPERRLSVVLLANLGNIEPGIVARRIAAICLDEPVPAPPSKAPRRLALSAAELAGWTGLFADPAGGSVWQLSAEDGRLAAESGPDHFELLPVAADRLLAAGAGAAFTAERQADGAISRLVLTVAGQEPLRLDRVQQAAPLPQELDGYAGRYACAEIAAEHEIRHHQGQLLIQMQTLPFPMPLVPMGRDEFTTRGVRIRFQRDAARRIRGFDARSTGVESLHFSGPAAAAPD